MGVGSRNLCNQDHNPRGTRHAFAAELWIKGRLFNRLPFFFFYRRYLRKAWARHVRDSPFLRPEAGGLWRPCSRWPWSPRFGTESVVSGWTQHRRRPPQSWSCIRLMWETQQKPRWVISSAPLTHRAAAVRVITMDCMEKIQQKTLLGTLKCGRHENKPLFKTRDFFFLFHLAHALDICTTRPLQGLNECTHLCERNYSCKSSTWHFEMLAVPLRDRKPCPRSGIAPACVNMCRDLRKRFPSRDSPLFLQRWPGSGSLWSEPDTNDLWCAIQIDIVLMSNVELSSVFSDHRLITFVTSSTIA